MQVFIIGSPLETAKVLDSRRLNKQIVECHQILKALDGNKAWKNHPCTLQYKNTSDKEWLVNYLAYLTSYRNKDEINSSIYSELCESIKPKFHTKEYLDNMKRRLFTKDPTHYSQYYELGTSNVNMYYVDNKWRLYENGRIMSISTDLLIQDNQIIPITQ